MSQKQRKTIFEVIIISFMLIILKSNLQQKYMRPSKVNNLISLRHLSKCVFITENTTNRPKNLYRDNIFLQNQFYRYRPPTIKVFQEQHQTQVQDLPSKLKIPHLQHKKEILRHENYSFKLLIQQHKQQALQLLTEAFDQKQPITHSFNLKNPQLKLKHVQNWASYWKFFIDDLINSRLSVAVFDTENFSEMVGIVVAKDYRLLPQDYEKKFMSSYNVVSQMMGLANLMIQRIDYEYQQILTDRYVMDLFGGTIKQKHAGKKLFSNILQLNLQLGKRQGFEYAFTYVTNFKSQSPLKKLGFEKMGDYDCRKYEKRGLKPFEMVQTMHKNPSLWLKCLS